MGKGRKPCCDKARVKRGPWSQAEDLKLFSFIQQHGHDNWRALPRLAGLSRCGKSCRLRWVNYLRPDLKRGNFTPEEEEAIIKLHQALGNKWSRIAAHFPGRTDNEIKNVWNTHLKKRIKAKESGNKSMLSYNSSTIEASPCKVQDVTKNNDCCLIQQVLTHQASPNPSPSPSTETTLENSSSPSISCTSSQDYHQMSDFDPGLYQESLKNPNVISCHVQKNEEPSTGPDEIIMEGGSLDELLQIPFEPDMWEMLSIDGDSNSANSEAQQCKEVESPNYPIIPENDNKESDNYQQVNGSSWWWLVYLENELGLDHNESTPLSTTSYY